MTTRFMNVFERGTYRLSVELELCTFLLEIKEGLGFGQKGDQKG